MRTEGSAYLDRSGRVLAADDAFRSVVGATGGDASAVVRDRARLDVGFAALLAGHGPARVTVAADGRLPAFEATRYPGEGGLLLRVAAPRGAEHHEAELALHAVTVTRLAASVAHEVKNPLNAMALQLALLGDKIAAASDGLAAGCAANLASMKNQIGRINDVVRRYVDVADPAPAARLDVGALVADATIVFAHEARRRRITLSVDAPSGGVHAAVDAVRASRLVLGLFWRAVGSTPEGGRIVARAVPARDEAVVSLEHPLGDSDPALLWMRDAVAEAARDLGGRLEDSRDGDGARTALVLPKEKLP